MVIRTLAQADDPVLKEKNKTVTSFKSLKVQQVIENLIDTMYDKDLIGIAAPQIGENFRIFVTHARNTKARNLGIEDKLRVYINPRLTYQSEEEVTIYEGCGSVQSATVFGAVTRSKEIEIRAHDKTRCSFSLRCDGILARVILHEMDHLRGIQFTEKLPEKNDLITQDIYVKTIKNTQHQLEASIINKIIYNNLQT